MQILLIRHGDKRPVPGAPESRWPLSSDGRTRARQVGRHLARVGIQPTVYLSSAWRHSTETAELLRPDGSQTVVTEVVGLTPNTDDSFFTWERILDDARGQGMKIADDTTVALVGHEPRLSQLLTLATGKRSRPFERLECVALIAKSEQALMRGQATVEARLPVRDFQERELRDKIRSKMQVTTFLAGFTLNAIVTLLRSAAPARSEMVHLPMSVTIPAHALRAASITSLFIALVLFASAAYIYDALAMPEGFWWDDERPGRFQRAWPQSFRRDLALHGPVYAYMIRTWTLVFSPAVGFTVVGFFALLVMSAAWPVVVACGAALLIGLGYYANLRPRLGVD